MPNKWIHVVAAIIVKNDNQYLIAKRPVDTHQGNLWEFPGGKVEPGEQAFSALQRELKEELDIEIHSAQAFLQIKHVYPDKNIFLDIYKVYDYSGEEKPKASQEIRWVEGRDIKAYDFPQANQLIVDALLLPEVVAITTADVLQQTIAQNIQQIVSRNINVILFRDYAKSDTQYLHTARVLNEEFKNRLSNTGQWGLSQGIMINRPELMQKHEEEFLGLHLNSENLKAFSQRPISNEKILSASCHNQQEISLAEKLSCDFVFLAPVLKTNSHPEKKTLGWSTSEQLVRASKLPVILLGGLSMDDLSTAKTIGALGIAGISSFWY